MTDNDIRETTREPAGDVRSRRKVLLSAMLGNVVEYYDFGLYGTLAVIISRQFFPTGNSVAALLSTYAGLVLSYALRPVAAMVLGPLADIKGRRWVLLFTIAVMSVGTAGIGLLPTYAAIGIAAPVILLLCRMLQGVGASVEYTTAANFIFEHERGNRRNYLAGLSVASTSVGPLLATLVSYLVISLMPAQAFNDWGWRIPFLLAIPMALIGIYIRRHVEETPQFQELAAAAERTKVKQTPFRTAVRDHWGAMLRAIGLGAGQRIGSFVIQAYFVTAMVKAGFAENNALLASLLTYAIGPVPAIWGGKLADRYGARIPLVVGYGLFVVLTVPTFLAIGSGSLALAVVAVVAFTFINNFVGAPLTTAYVMSFPAEVRASASALNYNIGTTALGSTAGLVAVWLFDLTGTNATFGWYMTGFCVLSILVALFAMPAAVDEQRRKARTA
ncbi:MFS transporter, MHS family, proline/betaine transporter [Amycolatopsis sacchari]|uniref:MFS transporter, MHS family, proline/betaine transporter n=1 Tax=Amycolatopsis sacchari TaxID=115433 RepID=A0A1I3JX77_9PSEU|nr:MFS transporter [Amycolatopsis sacchari]SFI64668.1 MFS transporter, MHS family, proline/betaine transporter [Amycolatopsis sacchari]